MSFWTHSGMVYTKDSRMWNKWKYVSKYFLLPSKTLDIKDNTSDFTVRVYWSVFCFTSWLGEFQVEIRVLWRGETDLSASNHTSFTPCLEL